jgi:endoglucanase
MAPSVQIPHPVSITRITRITRLLGLLIGLATMSCIPKEPAAPAATTTAASNSAQTEQQVSTEIPATTVAPVPLAGDTPIFEKSRALGAGVNLGNALDAPSEGAWGITLTDEDFTSIASVGFQHVRIPVRWSAHALAEAPYTIDATFAARVKWAIDSALAAGLRAIVNVHHYEEMAKEPDQHVARLAAIWKQIAEAYKGYPDTLYFELLNEANGALTIEKNNPLIEKLLAEVRPSNPDRAVIVGSVEWNSYRGLPGFELPNDPNLIVTIHYYDPFDFTHQGAPWANKQNDVGIDWPGRVGTRDDIARDFNTAVQWANEHQRPLYLGEFGAFSKAEIGARVRWTASVVQEARRRGLAYAYWEHRSGFGLYDLSTKTWRKPLLDAVLGRLGQ